MWKRNSENNYGAITDAPESLHISNKNFKKDFIYSFLERKGGRKKREGEKHQCVVASQTPPTGDLAHNPGMCLDWESNRFPWVRRPTHNPPSCTGQGSCIDFWKGILSKGFFLGPGTFPIHVADRKPYTGESTAFAQGYIALYS